MTGELSLEMFEPISLQEMDEVKLMNRVDTKFVTDLRVLEMILERARNSGYRVFQNAGKRLLDYDSNYFDTNDFKLFLMHHNRRLVRQKIRTRSYVNTSEFYLEVKNKNNHGRTKKKRVRIGSDSFRDISASGEVKEWLMERSLFDVEEMSPSLETRFNRITLVNSERTERLTIDLNVHFRNFRSGIEAHLGNAVIVELKQDGLVQSAMRSILLDLRVKQYRISKYCIGMAMTEPELKSNRFKNKVRYIEKINKNYIDYDFSC